MGIREGGDLSTNWKLLYHNNLWLLLNCAQMRLWPFRPSTAHIGYSAWKHSRGWPTLLVSH
jgi:hypothetical protein